MTGIILLMFGLFVAGTNAVLQEEEQEVGLGHPIKWTSRMLRCFTEDESPIESYESACRQLKEVEDCCRKDGDAAGDDRREVRSILMQAMSMTRNKLCASTKAATSRPWKCNPQLETIFNECFDLSTIFMNTPLEKFSFVECRSIYRLQDCIRQQILRCRSPTLLDMFKGFLRLLTSRTPCEQLENVNDM